jgi:SpoVK/Ycf46/Vps4 family AAA+-type ATPase
VAVLPPELVNRFKWRFFVDLPDETEKQAIWKIHLQRRGFLTDKTSTIEVPEDTEWNGREIEQCVETAWQLNCSVTEAAQFVVPVAQSSAEEIEHRRTEAAGRYLSASRTGAYDHKARDVVRVGNRQIRVKHDEVWTAPGSGKVN